MSESLTDVGFGDASGERAPSSAPPPRGAVPASHWRVELAARWAVFVDGTEEIIALFTRASFILPISIGWVVLIVALAYLSGGPVLGLRFPIFGAGFWLCAAAAFTAIVRSRHCATPARRALVFLLLQFACHLVLATQVAWAERRVALFLAAIQVLFIYQQSGVNPLGLRFPVWSAMPLASCLVVLGLPMESGRRALLLADAFVATLCSLGGSFPMAFQYQGHAQRAKLLAALEVQRATEEAIDAQRTIATLESVLSHSHDALSPLLAARATAGALREDLAGRVVDTEDFAARVVRLEEALERVAALLGASRDAARGFLREHFEDVDPLPIVERVVAEQRARFPGVALEADARGAAGVRLRVFQGEDGLARIVANLVVNACEGDARGRATRVRVLVRTDGAIVVSDDGPGFAAAAGPEAERGFKAGGVGLGLFTVQRLVHASGGTFRRWNRARGGAEVEVVVPRT